MKKFSYQRLVAIIDTIKQSPKPFRNLFAQFLSKTGLCRFYTIKMRGYNILFNQSSLSVRFYTNPAERDEDENFLKQLLKPGDVYVDVGANIGTLSLCASITVTNTGKVIAIEPHPKTFGYLKDNIALNGFTNLQAFNYAVGKEDGVLLFSSINSDDQNKVMISGEDAIKVAVKKLDSLLQNETHITLLKIDVEGFEKFVIEGAIEVLKRTDMVYYESCDQFYEGYGYNSGDLIALLQAQGFTVYRISSNAITALDASWRSVGLENLLALKNADLFKKKTGILVQS
jgi:FkbM family methyltransferase